MTQSTSIDDSGYGDTSSVIPSAQSSEQIVAGSPVAGRPPDTAKRMRPVATAQPMAAQPDLFDGQAEAGHTGQQDLRTGQSTPIKVPSTQASEPGRQINDGITIQASRDVPPSSGAGEGDMSPIETGATDAKAAGLGGRGSRQAVDIHQVISGSSKLEQQPNSQHPDRVNSNRAVRMKPQSRSPVATDLTLASVNPSKPGNPIIDVGAQPTTSEDASQAANVIVTVNKVSTSESDVMGNLSETAREPIDSYDRNDASEEAYGDSKGGFAPPVHEADDPPTVEVSDTSVSTSLVEGAKIEIATKSRAEIHTQSMSSARQLKRHFLERELGETPETLRAKKTEMQYLIHATRIIKNSSIKRTNDPSNPYTATPIEVTTDFFESKSRLAPATWNVYFYALQWYMHRNRSRSADFETAYKMFTGTTPQRIEKRDPSPVRSNTKRTIPEDHFNKLISELGEMNRLTGWGTRVQLWIQAAVGSGLRPSEWVGAHWLAAEGVPPESILVVRNAKLKRKDVDFHSPQPSVTASARHGKEAESESYSYLEKELDSPQSYPPGTYFDHIKKTRMIPIDDRDRIYVAHHMAALNGYLSEEPEENPEDRYQKYYNVCRKVLTRACKTAFNGKHLYSLYTMRSQYSSNLRATLPLSEVAARMGHSANARTTMGSYGPRKAAFGGKERTKESQKSRQTEANAPTEIARDRPGKAS